ncbi:MAG: divalent-cation tolerance protein CutA [Gammaproteobacteria bacterium]|nr:divalent-cation tolerance protein CutA [Gammaproteobacteria bacterium]
MTDIVLMLTTWPDQESAEKMAEQWLQNNLVACVNVLPSMKSIYMWNGKIQSGTEHQLLLKTTAHCTEQLTRSIVEAHPYECPEIIYLPVAGGYDEYMNWITGNTK